MFQVSASVILPLRPFMSYLGGAPFWITQKISPSLDPRVHSLSTRLDGFMFLGAIVLSPAPVLPWQNRQYLVYSCLPASIAAGDDGNAAFIFFASAGTAAGPAGAAPACANTLEAAATVHNKATHANNPDTPRILTVSFFACQWIITTAIAGDHRRSMWRAGYGGRPPPK